MPIPSPLAFPPTALRNVAAGLVVGNPIGSGGTRAKALTSAELKAIIEASGISYLPLSGGTLTGALSLGSNGLTCGSVIVPLGGTIQNTSGGDAGADGVRITTGGASFFRNTYDFATIDYPSYLGLRLVNICGISWSSNDSLSGSQASSIVLAGNNAVAQRNGLNAQCHIINKSYTSDSSQEALMLDAGKQISGKLGLYSYRGSSGGSNYPVQIGMLAADGSTFSGLTVAIDGGVSAAKIGAGGAAFGSYPLTVNGSAIFRDPTGTSFVCFHGKSGTWMGNADDNYAFASYKPSIYFFTNGEYASTASAAIALHAGSVTLGKALVPKTLADSAAPNGSVYYSSDAAKLVFKDAGGTVHDLY